MIRGDRHGRVVRVRGPAGRRRRQGLFGYATAADRVRSLPGRSVSLVGSAVRAGLQWYVRHRVVIFLVAWVVIVVGGLLGARLALDL